MNRTDHFLSRFMLQKHHGEQSSKAPETRDAAVIIPLISRAEGWSVLFTQRSWQLRHHPGQVCFPGGRKDTSDTSLQMTGLRELEEELGERPETFLGFNPLQASLEVKLNSEYANPDSLQLIEKKIKTYTNVSELLYRKDMMEIVNDNMKRIGRVAEM